MFEFFLYFRKTDEECPIELIKCVILQLFVQSRPLICIQDIHDTTLLASSKTKSGRRKTKQQYIEYEVLSTGLDSMFDAHCPINGNAFFAPYHGVWYYLEESKSFVRSLSGHARCL